MTDTPEHIAEMQLKLWLEKPPGERLHQSIINIEDMRNALRDLKKRQGLPIDGLDPVGEYLRKKNESKDSPAQ